MKGIFITLLLVLVNFESFGCSCMPKTFQEEIQHSELIVQAIIISIDTITTIDTYINSNNPAAKHLQRMHKQLLIKINLEKRYKGGITDSTTYLLTGIGGGDCGYPFVVNERYFIYGSKSDLKKEERKIITDKAVRLPVDFVYYETNICGRTTLNIRGEQKSLMVELALLTNK